MARQKKLKPRSTASAEFGEEPKGLNFNELPVARQSEAYNYYNYRYNAKYAREILSKRFPKIDWFGIRALDFSATIAWMFLMEDRGCVLSEDQTAKRDEFMKFAGDNHLKKKSEKPETVSEKITETYPDKKHLATFDDIEDELYRSFNVVEMIDKVKVLVSTIKKPQANEIMERCKVLLDELEGIAKDKDLKEAYKCYNSSNIRVLKKFFTTIIEHIGFTATVKRVVKVRKKKPVPIEKKLQHLKYQQSSDSFKLVSFNPEKLIGSNVVWLFNTKTRDLNRLESAEGFDIRGTTLINGASSKVRKIRKPEAIKAFNDNTRIRMDKEFAALKVNERDGNYRINQDTILLRVF